MTGFGFDGDVVSRHHHSRSTASGKIKPTHRAAYVEPILRASLFYRFPTITVRSSTGAYGGSGRYDGVRVQLAPVCPGSPFRSQRTTGRRLARPRRLSQARGRFRHSTTCGGYSGARISTTPRCSTAVSSGAFDLTSRERFRPRSTETRPGFPSLSGRLVGLRARQGQVPSTAASSRSFPARSIARARPDNNPGRFTLVRSRVGR